VFDFQAIVEEDREHIAAIESDPRGMVPVARQLSQADLEFHRGMARLMLKYGRKRDEEMQRYPDYPYCYKAKPQES
jgi:hypothetical protein